MILTIRTYVNYVSIETAIENATLQKHVKIDELDFTQNFLIPYEKSAYASYFLQHENNMLLRNEFIVKFEELHKKQESTDPTASVYAQDVQIDQTTPQVSWKKYIIEKLKD